MAYYQVPSYEVELTISSAKDLKNVNWRHGNLKPYAVFWVNPNAKSSTHVDSYGNTSPVWDEKLVISLTAPIEDSTLSIDIVQADAPEDTKPLIGSARLPLRDILDESGIGERVQRTLKLKRPSGRPQGSLDVKILLREAPYRAPPDQYYAPPYGVPPPPQPVASRDYYPSSYRDNYAAPPPPPVYYGGAAPPPPHGYPYDSQASSYGYSRAVEEEGKKKKGSKFGVGTGIAVGAVAGVLGGLALAEGVDHVENKIAKDAAEKVEDDLGDYDGDDY